MYINRSICVVLANPTLCIEASKRYFCLVIPTFGHVLFQGNSLEFSCGPLVVFEMSLFHRLFGAFFSLFRGEIVVFRFVFLKFDMK